VTALIRRRIRASGHVQGVGFRYSCRREAEGSGVAGWVTNCDDGSVEAVFEGPRDAVDSLVDWCRRGPGGASVSGVEVWGEEPTGERGFRVA
jgi:acylphosphatase